MAISYSCVGHSFLPHWHCLECKRLSDVFRLPLDHQADLGPNKFDVSHLLFLAKPLLWQMRSNEFVVRIKIRPLRACSLDSIKWNFKVDLWKSLKYKKKTTTTTISSLLKKINQFFREHLSIASAQTPTFFSLSGAVYVFHGVKKSSLCFV